MMVCTEVNLLVSPSQDAENPLKGRTLSSRVKQRKEVKKRMAASNWTVYVPDSTRALYFQRSFTPEEVKSALVSTGNSAVQSAEMVINGDTITFRRVQGGSKGVR